MGISRHQAGKNKPNRPEITTPTGGHLINSIMPTEPSEISSQAATTTTAAKSPKLLVHTVFGCALMDRDSVVYVKLGDEYVPKPMHEAQQGEAVLFAKKGVNVTPEKQRRHW